MLFVGMMRRKSSANVPMLIGLEPSLIFVNICRSLVLPPVHRMTWEQIWDCQPEEGGTGTRFLSCKKMNQLKGMFSFKTLFMKNFLKLKKQMFFVVSGILGGLLA
jgi:hypothetical protein